MMISSLRMGITLPQNWPICPIWRRGRFHSHNFYWELISPPSCHCHCLPLTTPSTFQKLVVIHMVHLEWFILPDEQQNTWRGNQRYPGKLFKTLAQGRCGSIEKQNQDWRLSLFISTAAHRLSSRKIQNLPNLALSCANARLSTKLSVWGVFSQQPYWLFMFVSGRVSANLAKKTDSF